MKTIFNHLLNEAKKQYKPMQIVIKNWQDIKYYCEAILADGGGYIEFAIYETSGEEPPWFDHKDCRFSHTPNPAESHPVIEGSIKWDGCTNMDIGPSNERSTEPFHFCGREEMTRFTTMLSRLYDVAAELMPNENPVYDKEVK